MHASALKKHKVLVANRSEIACRVFQACRELGLPTVAIFAPGDEEARHLTYADEVHKVGSYLDIPAIVATAQRAGATLIHPGYGFLSERPAFVSALEKAGIAFLGPTAETMEKMGGKIVAKEIATKAGVPTLPWAKVTQGGDMREAAKRVGFPLLLKAAAGGGGKGMRRVDRMEDLDQAAESASAEAVAAFGDGTLFLERLLDSPRHIEIQVFGDGTGFGVHLRERECSLQRRHQKVWEEATAPNLPEATRQGLFEASLRLVREVKYRSAGTLEFLVDENGEFFFLEMNTRLQVEHPVSELVTGVDLVHAQLLQAIDPSRPALHESPAARGHAIEVRLYAEDPWQDYIPTPGKVERLKWATGPGIRVDSGIEEGQTVGTSFDSLLAKVIVHAPTREIAIARMRFALDESVVLGMGTNQSWLRALCDQPRVIEGKVHVKWLEAELGDLWKNPSASELSVLEQARRDGWLRPSQGATAPMFGDGAAASKAFPSPWAAFAPNGRIA